MTPPTSQQLMSNLQACYTFAWLLSPVLPLLHSHEGECIVESLGCQYLGSLLMAGKDLCQVSQISFLSFFLCFSSSLSNWIACHCASCSVDVNYCNSESSTISTSLNDLSGLDRPLGIISPASSPPGLGPPRAWGKSSSSSFNPTGLSLSSPRWSSTKAELSPVPIVMIMPIAPNFWEGHTFT